MMIAVIPRLIQIGQTMRAKERVFFGYVRKDSWTEPWKE
jgi:hypothetical protein